MSLKNWKKKFSAAILFAVTILSVHVFAMQYNGEAVPMLQPDGSEVTVHLFGTAFFMTAESPDGYTLVRDDEGWISYATLNHDGSDFVSTGVRYTATSRPPAVRRNLRLSERATMERRMRNVRALGNGEDEEIYRFNNKVEEHERRRGRRGGAGLGKTADDGDDDNYEMIGQPAPWILPDTVVGMALFISFPDFPAPTGSTYDRWMRHVDSVYNRRNFNRSTNNAAYGSVLDYFYDISDGQLVYQNIITVFIQASQPFSHYDGADNYGRVQELITDVLTKLRDDPQYASARDEIQRRITRHPGSHGGKSRPAFALNIHPIRSGQRWAHGIWSHRGWYRGNVSVAGVPFYDYQFSGLGNSGSITNSSSLSTNVINHENGHMLFDWPDLYNYVAIADGGRPFVANFCMMANGTVMPNPFFRDLEGWITTEDITTRSGQLTHQANSHHAFVFNRTGVSGTNANRERYYIESRFSNGRSTSIPGNGLIIWHVHTSGDAANYSVNASQANRRTPRVAIVQANNGTGAPNAQSTFTSANGRNRFDSTTTPAARWHTASGATGELWNGPRNGLRIYDISAAPTTSNPRMTFSVGYGGTTVVTPTTYRLQVTGASGTGNYESGTAVSLTANSAPSGQRFLRWSSPSGLPFGSANVYSSPIAITTRAQIDTVVAHFATRTSLPGTVQGESYGFLTTGNMTTSGSSTPALNASGNGVAEYMVNVSPAGTYDITYRVASANGATLRLRRLSGTATIIDTLVIPATGGNTSYITITKNNKTLASGNQVWGIERVSGTFRLDWFSVETPGPSTFTLTVANGGTGGGTFEAGTTRNISANATRDGLNFVRWSTSNSAVIPENIYARAGEVTTIAANVTLTPHYGRVHPIPATAAIPRIEADTSGFSTLPADSTGVMSITEEAATGGRLGAHFAIGNISEYLVNVTSAGTYRFRYHLMTNGGTVDRAFRLRDVTNGVTLDSVTVPRSNISNTYMEMTELTSVRTVQLPAGNAVWQIEVTDGPTAATTVAMLYLDWFTAEPATTMLTVVGGTFEGCEPNDDDTECSGSHDHGATVEIEAVIPDGAEFIRWEGGGGAVADSTSWSTTITLGSGGNIVLTAVFTDPPTSVRHVRASRPLVFDLRANGGRINYSVANREHVNISVYDMRGRVVATLANGVMSPGHYSVSLNHRLGKGVYIVRMRSESFNRNTRMNIAR